MSKNVYFLKLKELKKQIEQNIEINRNNKDLIKSAKDLKCNILSKSIISEARANKAFLIHINNQNTKASVFC